MNIPTSSESDLLFINFNQDYSCISVGSKNGFKIYNCDPFGKCYSKTQGGVGMVEMLFCTSLVAIVGSGELPHMSPKRLQITNTKRQSTICELTFPTTILNVKLNRRRLMVVLEEQIYIYDISNMKLLHTIDTSPNPKGMCAMSPSSEKCYIAYPVPSVQSYMGAPPSQSTEPVMSDVMIFDANTCEAITVVQAHKRSVHAIAMNSEGTMLATASDKGTVIRIFTIPDAIKIAQFRRGTYPTKIYSITFNAKSTLLCVSSATDTIHIFKVGDGMAKNQATVEEDEFSSEIISRRSEYRASKAGKLSVSPRGERSIDTDSLEGSNVSFQEGQPAKQKGKASWKNIMNSKLIGKAAAYMPGAITEILEPSRDFAFLKLPRSGVQSIAAVSGTTPQVIVVTSEGYVYLYSLDLRSGGECTLLKQFSLHDTNESTAPSYT